MSSIFKSESTCTSNNTIVGGILHIHPLLQCNLSCAHCYSDSSPRKKEVLDIKNILPLIESIKEYRYNILSVSGGEPFLYKDLQYLLINAKQNGMRTQLVTNGILIDSKIAKDSLPYLDLVAISIDGDEVTHDKIRKMKGAYKKAINAANIILNSVKRLAIVSAVMNNSWKNMIEIAETAYAIGASLVHFHPLELSGRAITEIPNGIDYEELQKAYIVYNFLQEKYAGLMHIQMDCIHKLVINNNPEICGYFGDAFIPNKSNFTDISKSIILDEKGNVFPFSYGLSKKYFIGNIKNKNHSEITNMLENYIDNKAIDFSNLLISSYKKYTSQISEQDIIVWSEYIVEQSNII